MENYISSRPDSIQLVYDNYVQEKYQVNRRYQRKLVWEQEEKTKFIDSIIKKYPVPLFLVANVSDGRYEIIDGMQRLNAIVSFIENEIAVNVDGLHRYFDLSTLANTNALMHAGKIEQKNPILDKAICMEFVQYQLPFSFITATSEDVDEVFRRINSYGRQLSEQEIRQAGAVCTFSDVVREISSEVRGDISSSNILSLNRMGIISLSNSNLEYGIDINKVFWVKKGIVQCSNMRISRDEELVAYIVLHILFGYDMRSSSKSLNMLYHQCGKPYDCKYYDAAESKITAMVLTK